MKMASNNNGPIYMFVCWMNEYIYKNQESWTESLLIHYPIDHFSFFFFTLLFSMDFLFFSSFVYIVSEAYSFIFIMKSQFFFLHLYVYTLYNEIPKQTHTHTHKQSLLYTIVIAE